MYVEKTDTYTCDFCGHNAKWDASDDVHGELWSCEAEGCGKVFCSKCFISAFGQKIYMTMMQSGENVLCPEDSTPAATSCGNFATNRSLVG